MYTEIDISETQARELCKNYQTCIKLLQEVIQFTPKEWKYVDVLYQVKVISKESNSYYVDCFPTEHGHRILDNLGYSVRTRKFGTLTEN